MSLSSAATLWFFFGLALAVPGGVLFTFGARKPRTGTYRMVFGILLGLAAVVLGVWFGLKLHHSPYHQQSWMDMFFAQLPTCAGLIALFITDLATGGYVMGHRSSWTILDGKRVH